MNRNSNPNQFKLPPIIFFENHNDPSTSKLLSIKNLEYLYSLGYSIICDESEFNTTLEKELKTQITSLNNLDNFLKKVSKIKKTIQNKGEDPTTVIKTKYPKLYKDIQSAEEHLDATKHSVELLTNIKNFKKMDYVGIDNLKLKEREYHGKEEQFRELLISSHENRDIKNTKNILHFANKANGGVICIVGAAHFYIQHELVKKFGPEQEKNFICIHAFNPNASSNAYLKNLQNQNTNLIDFYPLGLNFIKLENNNEDEAFKKIKQLISEKQNNLNNKNTIKNKIA